MISQEEWNKFAPPNNPFLRFEFFQALIQSKSLSLESGWDPLILKQEKGALYSFRKSHSYGEYIFDWSWAEAYQRHGLNYYPKLTSFIPFTPVTTSHFLLPRFESNLAYKLLTQYHEEYLVSENSSSHFLYLPSEEIELFKAHPEYLIRETIQYHFFNEGFNDFEAYLKAIKSKRAKHIRQERVFPDLEIKSFTGSELTLEHAKRMYSYYISTIENKQSFDYLNQKFFELVFTSMPENILFVEAYRDDRPLAGSLFFYDQDKIYGRYWGSKEYVHNLHFELCYYQGIEFCLTHKLKMFEAGAQGEHKISRGFKPTFIHSAHHLKHRGFHAAVKTYIDSERKEMKMALSQLGQYLPFRS